MLTRVSAWWSRQSRLQQWGWATAGAMYGLILAATAGWAILR
jgi:hypothetical protein